MPEDFVGRETHSKLKTLASVFGAIIAYNIVTNTLINIGRLPTGFSITGGLLNGNQLTGMDSVTVLLNVLLFAPILETLLFQSLLQSFVVHLTKRHGLSIVVVSAAFFLWHLQNIWNALFAFGLGLAIGYIFSILIDRKFLAFLVVLLAHSFSNFLSLLFGILLQMALAWGQKSFN